MGNDTLIVDNVGDTVVEDNAAGEDTVKSSVTFTLGGNLENLVLTGSVAINGTGNGLDNEITGNGAANALVGNAGNDALNGGAGIDNMTGGIGDDIYVINTLSDLTNENPGEGDDTIQTTATLNLTTRANIENVTLMGTAAINATGDAGANILTGNNAVNTLKGGGGSDTLNGGKGNETYFRFTTASNAATNVDTITDFLSGTDSIELENSLYTKLTVTGPLNADNFFSGADITDTSGADANDFIKYDTGSGALYYDTNGNAAGGLQQFTALTGIPALVAADIDVT